MSNPLKIGLDIHGVIDTFPKKFKCLASAVYKDGGEVHIVTGSKRDKNIESLLEREGIMFTHYFSIVTHLEETGTHIDWRNGLPYADEDRWNFAKSEYCKEQDIDLMFDDSSVYLETFSDIETTFLHVIG